MNVSFTIVDRLNSKLGIPGRPHRILHDGQWLDTGCLEWAQVPSAQDAWADLSLNFADALGRFYESQRQRAYSHEPIDGQLIEFFSKEPEEIRTEFALFSAKLQVASRPPAEPLALPKPSDRLQEALSRIQARLVSERFDQGEIFDIESYAARAKELLLLEPAELQAEAAALAARAGDYSAHSRQTARRKARTLKWVRALLRDEQVSAYRAGIEWEGGQSAGYDTIVIAPTTDQFDILRYERIAASNRRLDTEEIFARLKSLNTNYGLEIDGATRDGLEFTLKRIPKGKAARDLGRLLLDLCPELGEAPTRFPRGRVSLWWD